ncbi:MAG: YceI family protein [Bacteroidota bacterium]
MKNLKFLSLMALALVAAACGSKPEGTDAEVSEAKEVVEVVASKTLEVNTTESVVSWIGSKPAGKHNGTIPVSAGNLSIEGDQIVGGEFTINIAGIENEDLKEDEDSYGKLIGHLKSPDFFDAESHPTAEFVITSVEAYDPNESVEVKEEFETDNTPALANEHIIDAPTHKITGNLTMRGNTLSISFPANVSMDESGLKASAKFNIDRTLWGVKYGDEATAVDKAKDQFIYNTVNVGFDLVAAEPAS